MQEHWFDPWVGNIPWRRNGNLFQYTCQDNPMDKGTWQATVHRVAKTWTWLSDWVFTHASYIPTFWRVFIINGCYYYCSVAKFCLTLRPHGCSMPGFPVLHHLSEFAVTHVHWVSEGCWILSKAFFEIPNSFISWFSCISNWSQFASLPSFSNYLLCTLILCMCVCSVVSDPLWPHGL